MEIVAHDKAGFVVPFSLRASARGFVLGAVDCALVLCVLVTFIAALPWFVARRWLARWTSWRDLRHDRELARV